MTQIIKGCLMAAGIAMMTVTAQAQLSTNPDKFLGNITTGWNSDMDTDGFVFSDYWNQVTPENATKWGSVEGDRQGKYNWVGADKAAKYAYRLRSNMRPSWSGWTKRRSTIQTCP